jgi:flagellar hook-basal body complex protein FliE
MSISGIEAIGSSMTDLVGGINPTLASQANATGYLPVQATAAAAATESTFAATLTGAVNNIQQKQEVSADLAIKAVTGDLDDIHDYTIAATESAVTLELTTAIRNKAVDAFNEIMRMQV